MCTVYTVTLKGGRHSVYKPTASEGCETKRAEPKDRTLASDDDDDDDDDDDNGKKKEATSTTQPQAKEPKGTRL